MERENSTKLETVLKTRRSWKPERTFKARMIILCSILTLFATSLALQCSAATAQAMGIIVLRVEPEATMTVTPLGSGTDPDSGETIQLLKVDLAIRLNSGTTASLWLQQAPESSEGQESKAVTFSYYVGTPDAAGQSLTPIDSSQVAFMALHNGRYYLTIGVKAADGSNTNASFGKNIRLELKSSDGVLHLITTL